MNILYLSQYFPPEAGATQTRAYEMARNWVRLGHTVTMITEFPNHPSGIIPGSYKGKLYERDYLDGIEVIRIWVKASPRKNFNNRMLFYLTYMLGASIAGLFLARQSYDLVYASSPPLFVGGAALFLSRMRRLPLFFEVRDLWPESAIALGELTNPRAIALASRLEEACYQRARLVVVVTQGILNRLIKRSYPRSKLTLIPNGVNIEMFTFSNRGRDQIRRTLNLGDKFVAIYAGVYGIAYSIETVIKAAYLLVDEPDIHILLIGDGPRKDDLTAMIMEYHLPNLTMLPEQPLQEISNYISAADIALIPLRNLDFFSGTLPVKMFDAWACERPVLLSVSGEALEVMQKAGGGISVPPEDPRALADTLRTLKNQSDNLQQMGVNGRQYVVEHYSRKVLAEKLAHLLEAIIS